MEADITRQILDNYKVFSDRAKQAEGAMAVSENTSRPTSQLQNSTKMTACKRRRKRKKGRKTKDGSKVVHSAKPTSGEAKDYCYRELPSVTAKLRPLTSKRKHTTVDLRSRVQCVEHTTPISEITQQLMGGDIAKGPIVTIQPKELLFNITDPEMETKANLLLTNNTAKMELFKVKTTNPYLFRLKPSTGYIYPKETLEVAITLLEGVDVKSDKFLVMVAEIDNEKEQLDQMSSGEIIQLWKVKHTDSYWSHVYQEKVSCRCCGNYRAKSRVLISAFDSASADKKTTTTTSSNQLHTSNTISSSLPSSSTTGQAAALEPTLQLEVTPDAAAAGTTVSSRSEQDNVFTERSEERDLWKVEEDHECTALVPYAASHNKNSNANLDEWLSHVPAKQVSIVKELYHELMSLQQGLHSVKLRLDDMKYRVDNFHPLATKLNKKHVALKDKVDTVKSYVQQLSSHAKIAGNEESPKDVRARFMDAVDSVNKELEGVVEQHQQIWKTLQQHDININKLKNVEPSTKHMELRHRNRSQNARLDRHYVYDERRRENARIKDLELNQLKLGKEMTDIGGNIAGLSRRAQAMTDVLKNVTNELKQQRRDATGDMDKLEMKYLEQCTLLPLQELGKQNQDLLNNLYSSFMSHIEKVNRTLERQMGEHRTLSHFIDQQTLDYNKLRKGVCQLGKGIQAEHQHIVSVTDANRKRFDQLELHHLLLENHMKDIHSALKGLMTKAKVIADQANKIELDLGTQRQDLEDNINNMRRASVVLVNKQSGNFDGLFESMKDRLGKVNSEIKRLREASALNDRRLQELTSNLRQQKDHVASQLVAMEQKTAALIERQLQEARRNFDTLQSDVASFQGTLKGMDTLLISSNEKMKTLYADLERYKKAVTEEMHRLAKDIGEAAGGQVLEITKAHGVMRKQIEGLLESLGKAQLDAKAITARMNDIENELTKKTDSLLTEIKKAVREANTADAVKAQRAEQFYNKAEQDIQRLKDELQNIKDAANLILGKADEMENRTKQKLDELRAALDQVTSRLEKITSSLLEEFYNKMQRGAEQVQEKLSQQHNQLMHYIDSKLEDQARKHADSARDQVAEVHLKMEHTERLSEATRVQLDKIFYILILLIILLPMFMYTAYMGKSITTPTSPFSIWWNSCGANLISGKRDKAEL